MSKRVVNGREKRKLSSATEICPPVDAPLLALYLIMLISRIFHRGFYFHQRCGRSPANMPHTLCLTLFNAFFKLFLNENIQIWLRLGVISP